MNSVKISQKEIANRLKLNVKLPKLFGVRIKLMLIIIKLAVLVGGVSISVS